MKIGKVSRGDKVYPEKLMDERVKPIVKRIWYKGEWDSAILERCAAVVGSRKMSRYGRQALSEIIPRLVGSGYTIVSGLMYGVDQEAHRLTLESGGKALGVLGYGIDYQSESGAMEMVKRIVESGGIVISEYEGKSVSQRWMFPQRNRIVVGLSDVVVIAEGAVKSGTMSTASWAKKMGKPIYAVPGSVFSLTSEGVNYLVSEGLAKALTKEELNKLCGPIKNGGVPGKKKVSLTGLEQEIVTHLKISGPTSTNELARAIGIPVGEVLSNLMKMEMKGVVAEERGVWGNV